MNLSDALAFYNSAQGADNPIMAFRAGRDVRDARRNDRQVNEQLKNYMTDPDATIKAVNQFDPRFAIGLQQQQQAQAATEQKRKADTIATATGYLRGLPPGSDYGSEIDKMSPMLQNMLGMKPDDVAGWRAAITANPGMITALDDDANKERAKFTYGATTVAPGASLTQGGKEIYRAPYAPQVKTIRRGDGGTDLVPFDPNTGAVGGGAGYSQPGPAGGGGAPGSLNTESLLPMFIAQESGGDYKALNTETGALGKYQIMPATGASLAKRLNLPWRPDMMRGDDQASRNYQDALGKAAVDEAVANGGGTPEGTFSYYYSGSPTAYRNAQGNPKTARYVQDMMGRFGGGGPAPAAPMAGPTGGAVYSTPGKPQVQIRNATPEELQGYPAGTMAQVDPNGKLINIRTPPASVANANNKNAAQYAKVATMVSGTVDSLDQLREAVLGIQNTPDLDSYLGNVSGRLPSWTSQGRANFYNDLEALKTQIGMTALSNMRAQSPTGGALGNVSNYENKMLQRSLASLETSSSGDAFRKNLGIVLNNIDRAKRRMADALARTPGGPSGSPAPAQPGGPPKPGGFTVGQVIRNKSTGEERTWTGSGWRITKKGN